MAIIILIISVFFIFIFAPIMGVLWFLYDDRKEAIMTIVYLVKELETTRYNNMAVQTGVYLKASPHASDEVEAYLIKNGFARIIYMDPT